MKHLKTTQSEAKDILELLHLRRKHFSTIFSLQYCHEGWYEQLGEEDASLTDAILDRRVHDSYKINIESIRLIHARDLWYRKAFK